MPSNMPVSFEPIKENHAIAEVVFLLDFSESLLPHELESILGRHNSVEKEYPFFTKHFSVLTGIPSREGLLPSMSTPREVLTGIQFFDQLPFQESISSVFLGEGMRINSTEYKGWGTNREAALNVIKALLTEYLSRVTRISLAYRDSFIACSWGESVDKNASLGKLFRKESKFIPSSVFSCEYPWHSHHGFFECKTQTNYSVLSNINTGLICQENTESRTGVGSAEVYISTEMNRIIDNELRNNLDMDMVTEIFEDLHDRCKNVVRDLLTNDVLSRIGIEEQSQHPVSKPEGA